MSILSGLLPVLGKVGERVADKFFPDPADAIKRQQMSQEFITSIIGQSQEIDRAAAEIIKTEAASDHWLAANWRPLTMITFVGLIVARWFGWAAPALSEAEYLKLWSIVEFGLGGYVVGRSVEKMVPSLADAIKGLRK
jgi:hypothetical protein